MTLYRIRFELCSSIVTPLKGDTIWGHIVWGIANHEGDKAVQDFLEKEKSDPPLLVVSSAFPAGMICRSLPLPRERKDILSPEKYSEIKKDKKNKYMNANDYFIETEKILEIKKNPFGSIQVMHNTIDRDTNTVLEGALYSTEEKWSGFIDESGNFQKIDWDIYILSSLDKDRVKQLVEWAFEYGYGADASTGKGNIHIKSDAVPVTFKKQGNTYMALAPFVKHSGSGLSNIRADIFVRQGKIGGAFASSLSPYKKTVILFDEGAVFTSNEKINYTGILLREMHQDKRICQAGFAPVIPIE